MRKHFLGVLAVLLLGASPGFAFNFTVDIDPGNFVVGDSGTSPFTGSVMLGYFAAGTDFTQPFENLDSSFHAVTTGSVGAGGFVLGLDIPGGGNWSNGTLNWTSSAAQDGAWDATFNGRDMALVFINVPPRGDGFAGTPNPTLFDGVTSYLIVDSRNDFFNAALSGLGSSFATLDTGDPILKASGNSAIVDSLPTAATFDLAAASVSLSEADGALNLDVTRSGVSTSNVSISYTTVNGTGAAGTDYTTTSGTLNFASGETKKTIVVPIANRAGFQPSRDFQFQLSNPQPPADAQLGSTTSTTVTITDTSVAQPGEIRLSSATYSVAENAGPLAVTVQRVNGTDGAVSVTLDTANGTALAGSDYTGITGLIVTFADGDATDKTVNIVIANDADFEVDETFTIALSAPTGGVTLGSRSSATATIVNDDAPPSAGQLRFVSPPFSVNENAGSATLQVERVNGTSGSVAVQIATSNGTALAGTHYTAANTTLTWNNGEAGTKSLPVPIIDNTAFQATDLVFNVTLSNATGGASINAPASTTVTIINDDPAQPGTLAFDPATYSFAENAGTVNLTVKRTNGTDTAVAVNFATVNGTAVAGTDFTVNSGTLNFAAGEESKSIAIALTNNNVVDPDRSFTVQLNAPTNGATLGAATTATITITNEDLPATVALGAGAFSVNEGGTVSIPVTRSGNTAAAISVNYTTASGSAIAGSDFTTNSGTLNFAAGQTTQNVPVVTLIDQEPEAAEVFFFQLSTASGGVSLLAPSQATITINRNSGGLDQPDLQVSSGGGFVGQGVYNTTGDGQIQTLQARPGNTTTFKMRVKNAGPITDAFILKATGGGTASGTQITCEVEGRNVTSQILSATGFTVENVRNGREVEITVKIKLKSGADPFQGYGVTLRANSVGTPAKTDTAIAVVIAI